MARSGGIHTATAQFFINTNDNRDLVELIFTLCRAELHKSFVHLFITQKI